MLFAGVLATSSQARSFGGLGHCLSRRGLARRGAPPRDVAHAARVGMLLVHGARRNGAGIARSVRDSIGSEDERDGSLEHEQARVELVRVRSAVPVWLDLALADLVAFANELGFEFGPGHDVLPIIRGAPRPAGPQPRDGLQRAPLHAAVTPPSTGSATPVTNDASSERRNSAAFAISSGRPVRPSGTEPWARLRTSSSGSMPAVDFWSGRATKTRSIGVSMGPGHTAFTRIFSGARRSDRLLTKPTTPNLHIEYTGLYAEPWRPDVDAVNRRLPPPRARISGIAASVVISTVLRLRLTARSNALMSMPSTAAGPGWPTWFHTKSRPLKRATVSHTIRR